MRDGFGKIFKNGKLIYEGNFKENKKHGEGIYYKLEGPEKLYFENDKLIDFSKSKIIKK